MTLKITSVQADGDETKESIELVALADCQASDFVIADSTFVGSAPSNKQRHYRRFGKLELSKGDRIKLHTGVGEPSKRGSVPGRIEYELYWGLDHAVWNDAGDKAYLIQIAKISPFKIS